MNFFNGLFNKKQPVFSDDQKREVLTDLAGRIKKFLPDEKNIGQPFWALMELRDGRVNGNYFRFPNNGPLPLFISKYYAESFLAQHPEEFQKAFSVRGLNQEQIRMMANSADETNGPLFALFLHPENDSKWYVRQINGKMLRSEFLWE